MSVEFNGRTSFFYYYFLREHIVVLYIDTTYYITSRNTLTGRPSHTKINLINRLEMYLERKLSVKSLGVGNFIMR